VLGIGRTEPGTPMSAFLASRRPEANRLHLLPRRLRSLPMQEISGGSTNEIPDLCPQQEAHRFFQDCELAARNRAAVADAGCGLHVCARSDA